jgi:NAD(P)-dependent dehydrogenase (short-subunit alcohol dehydrogenase family)
MEWIQGKMGLRDTFNKAYDTNVTGAHMTSYEFMPLLLKSSEPRLLFVAGLSHMTVANEGPYFPTPPLEAGWPKKVDFETIAYRCSKTALNMLMLDWNHKLKADGVKVFGVGPGFLATNLGNMKDKVAEMGGGHPSEGGIIYKKVVEGERDDQVGKVIDKDGLVPL